MDIGQGHCVKGFKKNLRFETRCFWLILGTAWEQKVTNKDVAHYITDLI